MVLDKVGGRYRVTPRRALSSAKSPVMVWGEVGWSEVKRLYKRSAATAPWGTPAQIEDISDMEDPELTEKCLFSR